MKKVKIYTILILSIILILVILISNTFAEGIWELQNNWYHIDGTWTITPNSPQVLNMNDANGQLPFPAAGPVSTSQTADLDVNISYALNWVPDSPAHKNRPRKRLWIQEYGRSYTAWESYPGILTAQGHADCEIGGTPTNWSDIPDGLRLLLGKWCQIETVNDLPWKMVRTGNGHIERTVHFASGWDVPSGDYGQTWATARLNVVALSSIRKPTRRTPYNTTSGTSSNPPSFDPSTGGGNGGGDPIDYATGEHAYLPTPDITVYNPYGPSATYRRNCWSGLAGDGEYSPGLTSGWVHNYDVTISQSDGGLTLRYPNGAEEDINPSTGSRPAGAPYTVAGVAAGNTWSSITITFTDQTKWIFVPAQDSTDIFIISRIMNRVGRYIEFTFDKVTVDSSTVYRLKKVDADQVISSGSTTLMTLTYSGNLLSSITDIYGRTVHYTYDTNGFLGGVSTIDSTINHWEYGYEVNMTPGTTAPDPFVEPHLRSIKFLSPSGSGYSEQIVEYNNTFLPPLQNSFVELTPMDVRVESFKDANNNRTTYTYGNGTTREAVDKWSGEWIAVQHRDINYELGLDGRYRRTGETDQNNHSSVFDYSDSSPCPYKPLSYTDKNGKITEFTYDGYGHLLTVTRPRGTTTTYTYDHSTFVIGRLVSIQEEGKSATTITYYEPSGMVHTITSPSPTGIGTVQVSYTYDALGNRLTATYPDASGNSVTITYDYITDGTYTQTAKIAQPLTITDGLGRTTHYRYDNRGNTVSVKDDAGNETNITYNAANQPLMMILPPEVKQ